MKIAILTGVGDAPGLNPVIRAVAKVAHENNVEMIGIKRGWAGLVELNHFPLKWKDVKNLHSEGGTFLLSSRTNPIKMENGIKIVSENLKQVADGLIAMGGEDTLGVANELYKNGVNVVGVPKTIDNDLFLDFTYEQYIPLTSHLDITNKLKLVIEGDNGPGIVDIYKIEGSKIQKKVWSELKKIKPGHTKSYGEIAKKYNLSPRYIGKICSQNKLLLTIPCHRVIRSDGNLGGFTSIGGVGLKKILLDFERLWK